MTEKTNIGLTRESVREYYGERARSSNSCCSPQDSFYNESEINFMPADVSNFSLGCGNAVGEADLKLGESVLDLGSGGGLECFVAARQVGAKGAVIGIDMTDDMLNRAREAADRMGFKNVDFRKGLIESLPVDAESIDVIISNCVINLSPDKPAVFREMHRVLKTGGRLAISDVVTYKPIADKYREDSALWNACASGALEVSQWENYLKDLGFVDITVTPKTDDDEFANLIPDSEPFSAIIKAVKAA